MLSPAKHLRRPARICRVGAILLLMSTALHAQYITLVNPSFEDTPRDATVPQGWMACKAGTTPDILPGYWGVYTPASDGDTYVGLITRQNGTWESIGQRLTADLQRGVCYAFSIDLAHADTYSGYNGPVRLRIWAGSLKCLKDQLLWESQLIEHTEWRTYPIRFTPDRKYRYLLLEAFHTEEPYAYPGNILIDRITAIKGCDKT